MIFFNMKVCCVFSLESPHRGHSKENTQYTILNKKITLNYPESSAMAFCPKGLKNKFETAVVNEPLVCEPLKVYCTFLFFSVFDPDGNHGSVKQSHFKGKIAETGCIYGKQHFCMS